MPKPSDLELITLHTAALFSHDGEGRITGSNEPDPRPAPRLYIGRSPAGNVWRVRADVPVDLAARLDDVLQREPPSTDLELPPGCLAALKDLLEAAAPVTQVPAGPAWLLPPGAPPPSNPNVTTALSPEQITDADQLFASAVAPTLPYAAVVIHGRVVALCSCSRITPHVAEAGLITLPEFRGRGYGTAVTAAWAAAIRATGRLPLYSTSWDNHASRRVAAKLGARLYGADFSMA